MKADHRNWQKLTKLVLTQKKTSYLVQGRVLPRLLRLDNAEAIGSLIKRAARQAHLPLLDHPSGDPGEATRGPKQQQTGSGQKEGRGSSRGKGSGGVQSSPQAKGSGKAAQKGGSSQEKAASGRGLSGKGKSPGAAASQEKKELPILFAEDWDVTIVKAMLPGLTEGIYLAENMKEAKRAVDRMKGARGHLAMVSLDKIEQQSLRQEQLSISLGVKSGGAYKVHVTQVWLTQLGDGTVAPKNAVQTVTIKPSLKTTSVTAFNVCKKEAKQDLLKALADRDNSKLLEKLKEAMQEPNKAAADVFAVKDDGNCYYGLIRYATEERDALLKISGEAGVYIKTPREDLDKFAVAWLPGDTAKKHSLALEVLKGKPNHRGLVQGKAGYGVRALKEDALKMREAQGQDITPAYLMKGLPPSMTKEELGEVLKSIGWAAKVEEGGRRMAKGGATWRLHAASPPNKTSFVMNYGYLRCTIYIQDLAELKKAEDEDAKFSTKFAAPKTWAEAVAPKAQKPLPKAQAEEESSEEEFEEAEELNAMEEDGMQENAGSFAEEREEPDSKKRRTVFEAPPRHDPNEARFQQLEQRQANIDNQLAQILAMLSGLGGTGQGITPPPTPLPTQQRPSPQGTPQRSVWQEQLLAQQQQLHRQRVQENQASSNAATPGTPSTPPVQAHLIGGGRGAQHQEPPAQMDDGTLSISSTEE